MDNDILMLDNLLNMGIGDIICCRYDEDIFTSYLRVLGGFYNAKYGKINLNQLLILLNTDDYSYDIIKVGFNLI